jgi:hypothetical protein
MFTITHSNIMFRTENKFLICQAKLINRSAEIRSRQTRTTDSYHCIRYSNPPYYKATLTKGQPFFRDIFQIHCDSKILLN